VSRVGEGITLYDQAGQAGRKRSVLSGFLCGHKISKEHVVPDITMFVISRRELLALVERDIRDCQGIVRDSLLNFYKLGLSGTVYLISINCPLIHPIK
jgi:hypothetical protein